MPYLNGAQKYMYGYTDHRPQNAHTQKTGAFNHTVASMYHSAYFLRRISVLRKRNGNFILTATVLEPLVKEERPTAI